jgi:hypothetical protein
MPAPNIARLRIRAQGIAPTTSTTPEAAVAHLGAVQAQDYPGALWSIVLRTQTATRVDVERAIAERAIVRTWPMRGTLHFIPAADARWMLELMTPRIMQGAAGRHRQLELDDAAFARSRTIVARALETKRILSRPALFAALERGGISTAGQRGIHIVQRLCMERMLCFGPHEEKQPTFVLFDEWITSSRAMDRDQALGTMAERYFRSHGPATLRDFSGWTGLKVSDARIGLQLALPALEPLTVDDTSYWMQRGLLDAPAAGSPAQRAHLMPGFDEFMLGYKDRSAALPLAHAPSIVPGNNGMFLSTLVLDGRVCGTWRRSADRTSTALDAAPFEPLSAAQKRAFGAAVERYARFAGSAVSLRWMVSTAGESSVNRATHG